MARKKIEWVPEMGEEARRIRLYGTQDTAAAIAELTGELPRFDPYAHHIPPSHPNCRCEIIPTPSRWKFNLFWIVVLVGAELVTLWLS